VGSGRHRFSVPYPGAEQDAAVPAPAAGSPA
jgi:hypothetical protein